MRTRNLLQVLLLCWTLVAPMSLRAALLYEVTIASPVLELNEATIAFDLVDGGPPSNSVAIGSLASDGAVATTSSTGDVSGSGPWLIGDGSFFNELLVAFDPFGSSLTFQFSTTEGAADAGSFPDAFALFVLTPDLSGSLVTTDDPTGANALFLLNIGEGPRGLTVYTPLEVGVSISVLQVSDVAEPATAWLVACALFAALGRSMHRRTRDRIRIPGARPGQSLPSAWKCR